MSQQAEFIKIAQAEVGTIEGPKENETKYGKFTKANFQPWCGSFIMWCAKQAGLKIPNVVWTPGGAAAFQGQGRWSNAATAKPAPGDICFFDFPGGKEIDHVGIVIKDNGDGTVTTVEGNTSPEKKTGSQANGGEVCIRIRGYKKNKAKKDITIVGFGHPKFKKDTPVVYASADAAKAAAKK